MNDQFKKDLTLLLDILWQDEERSFEESDCPDNHIFNIMLRLREELESA